MTSPLEIIVSQVLGKLRPVGFRFIETHQVVATKKLRIFDLQPVYMCHTMILPFVGECRDIEQSKCCATSNIVHICMTSSMLDYER